MCEECYSDENRITPLLNPLDCLENHTQYICGTCGRCICIECDPKRGCKDGIFPSSHWKSQNFICGQPTSQQKAHAAFTRLKTAKLGYLIKFSPQAKIWNSSSKRTRTKNADKCPLFSALKNTKNIRTHKCEN